MKHLLSVVSALLLGCLLCNAETIKRTDKFTSFTGIRISDEFEVEITEGVGYSVALSLDARASDYCRVYLQGSLLVLEVDEKAYPKELKEQLHKKGVTPLKFEAVVTIPRGGIMQNITVEDCAVLSCKNKFDVAQSIQISASKNAVIRDLDIKASEVEILATNKASVQGTVNASNILLKALNSASYVMQLTGSNAEINMEASSKANIVTSLSEVVIKQNGYNTVNVQGTAKVMSIQTKSGATTDARNLNAENIVLEMQSSSATLTGNDQLNFKNLSSGAKVSYSGTPDVIIGHIVNSSVDCTEIAEADRK